MTAKQWRAKNINAKLIDMGTSQQDRLDGFNKFFTMLVVTPVVALTTDYYNVKLSLQNTLVDFEILVSI